MNFNTMTNQAVARELGRRMGQLRLENNLSQHNVAEEIGISRVSYAKLEAGEAKFINVIAALRVLGHLAALETFIPGRAFSPMELLKLQGKKRKRASSSRQTKHNDLNAESTNNMDW